ncbi:hypothetical protein D3C84_1145990 [compost metagenome]
MRSAIIDADDNLLVVVQVGDPHARAERQLAVRGGQGILVEAFAAGGLAPVVPGAVPGSLAFGAVTVWIDHALAGAGAKQQGGEQGESDTHGGSVSL